MTVLRFLEFVLCGTICTGLTILSAVAIPRGHADNPKPRKYGGVK